MGRNSDVQNGFVTGLEQPVGRTDGVHSKRSADIPAVSGHDTGREGVGRKNDMAVQGTNGQGGDDGAVRDVQ